MPGMVVVIGPVQGRVHSDADAYEPHAVYNGSRWAVCARSTNGIALFQVLQEPFTMLEPMQPPAPVPAPGWPGVAPAHLKGCGYFFRDTGVYAYIAKYGGENPAAPGTHSVIVDDFGLPAEPHPDGHTPRMIVGGGQLIHGQMASWWDRVDAVFIANETRDPAELRETADFARMLMRERGLTPKPLLSYSAGHIIPSALEPTDIFGVQLYAERGPDPVANLRAQAAAIWPQIQHVPRVAIIGQAYDRGGWFTGAACASLQPSSTRLRRHGRTANTSCGSRMRGQAGRATTRRCARGIKRSMRRSRQGTHDPVGLGVGREGWDSDGPGHEYLGDGTTGALYLYPTPAETVGAWVGVCGTRA